MAAIRFRPLCLVVAIMLSIAFWSIANVFEMPEIGISESSSRGFGPPIHLASATPVPEHDTRGVPSEEPTETKPNSRARPSESNILHYPGCNFETHTPTYLRRRWVFEAYCEFRDFITEDRWYGMLGPTAILNHAYRQHRMPLVHLETEGLRAGFWGKLPADRQTVVAACRGKAFLNFDDDAFGPGLHRYLAEQFPTPSCYERPDNGAEAAEWIACVGVPST